MAASIRAGQRRSLEPDARGRLGAGPCVAAGAAWALVLAIGAPWALPARVVSTVASAAPIPGVTDTALANALPRINRLHLSQKHDSAYTIAVAAIAAARPGTRADSLLLADVLDFRVLCVQRLGRWTSPEADSAGLRAIAIRERVWGSGHHGVVPSSRQLAQVVFMRGERTRALAMMEQAVRALERSPKGEDLEFARTLNIHGQMLADEHQFERARATIERSRGVMERLRGPRSPAVANCLNSLAHIAARTGYYEEAVAYIRAAIAMQRDSLPPSHPEIPRSLVTLGGVEYLRGDYVASRRAYEEALDAHERARPGHTDIGITLQLLGVTQRSLRDLDGARRSYERSLEILERNLGPNHYRVSQALHGLAQTQVLEGRADDAVPLYRRSVAIAERSLGARHQNVTPAVADFAKLMRDRGDLAAADSMLTRVDSILVASPLRGRREHAQALAALASVRHRRGRDREAQELHERAVTLLRASVGPDHPALATALADLAAFRRDTGDRDGALEASLEAERIGREHFLLLAWGLSEREALAYAASRPAGLDQTLNLFEGGDLGDSAAVRAWDGVVRSRGLVLDEMAERRRAAASATDPTAARLDSLLARARSRYARLLVRGPEGDSVEVHRRLLERARAEMEDVERELSARSVRFGRMRQRVRIGFDAVRSVLPDSTSLVSYVRYRAGEPKGAGGGEARYLAMIATDSSGPVVIVPLGPAGPIDSLVRAWRGEMQSFVTTGAQRLAKSEAGARRVGAALRARVWDPVTARLPDGRRVMLVSDGLLHLVHFGALPAGDGYLIERGPPLRCLTSERDLVPEDHADRRGIGVLAMGGPDFDAAVPDPGPALAALDAGAPGAPEAVDVRSYRGPLDDCEDFQDLEFAPLPGAAREARAVVSTWRAARGAGPSPEPAFELIGAAASEPAFKRLAPHCRLLHVGTHGFFLGDSCVTSGVSLRGVGGMAPALDAEATSQADGERHPLRLAGLALAGANRRASARADQDDGVLTAEEIAALDLDRVECVVLSGCDTGVGDVASGEGVIGLQRAFRIAGAGTLVMSLWPVEDRAARLWMEAFYRARFERRLAVPDAAREASLERLNALRSSRLGTHPFFWAPFVTSSDGF